MADNIGVRPSTTTGSVNVATDEVDGVHYPVYKIAVGEDGAATPVGENDPLHVSTTDETGILACLTRIEKELKKLNLYNALAHDVELTNEDI